MPATRRSRSSVSFALALAGAVGSGGPLLAQEVPVPPPAAATPVTVVSGGLTADQVGREAARTSFEVLARAEDTRAAAAAYDAALAGFIPRLSGVARYSRLSPLTLPTLGTLVGSTTPGAITDLGQLRAVTVSFPNIENQYLAQATLQVPLSDYLLRLPQQLAAASGSRRAAELSERAAKLDVATRGRLAFYNWARAKWQLAVARQTATQTRARLADVERLERAGAASKADVLRLESQAAQADLLVTRGEALVEALERQLRVILHDERGGTYDVGEDVESEVSFEGEVALASSDPAPLYREAGAARLELKSLAESAEALRQQGKVARAAGLPRLHAVGNAVYANPNQRLVPLQERWRGTWDASIQLSWAPTDLFGSEAQRRQALARAEGLEAQRRAALDGVRIEVSQAVAALREAAKAQVTSTRALAAAEESYRVRRLLAENGRATTVEITDAETDLLRARLDVVAARIEARAARTRLEHALGRDVGQETR